MNRAADAPAYGASPGASPGASTAPASLTRRLAGPVAYLPVWEAMRSYTDQRDAQSGDEIWLTEHTPVYTLGQAGKPEHLLCPGDIPVVQCDRGGQVTYHGPGQIMAYVLFDLRRVGIHVRDYVYRLEQGVLDALESWGLAGACRQAGAPGIYVPLDGQTPLPALPGQPAANVGKVAALGVKIRNGRAYHGVSLNLAMDLEPFGRINPCGYAGLRTVDLAHFGVQREFGAAGDELAASLWRNLLA